MKQLAWGIILGLLLIAGVSRCARNSHELQQAPVAAPDVAAEEQQAAYKLPSYETFNEAAVHAILRAKQCSIYYECGGAIAERPDHRFVVGPVGTDYSGDSLEGDYSVPKGWTKVAEFHTHACLPHSHYTDSYSVQDIASSIHSGLPEVMGDLCSGEVHLYDPATMPPQDFEQGPGRKVSKGKIVGRIVITERAVEPDTGL